MKHKAVMSGASLVALLAFVGIPAIFASTYTIDRIIARVNEEIITQRQYDEQKQKLHDSLAQHYSGDQLAAQYNEGVKDLLENMIDEDLFVQKAKDLNINVESQVVQRLDQIRQQMGLASIQDLEDEVEKNGLVWEDFQNNIRRQLLTDQVMQQEVASRIMPTDADLRKYFAAHKQDYASPAGVELSEIQISNQKWGAAQAAQRGKEAKEMLQAGAKWNDAVKKYSDGPNSNSGGDVGFFPSGSLLPEISKAIEGMDPGDTSSLISTQNGYIIVKLNERRSAGSPKFEEVRQRVENDYYQEKMRPAVRSYLTTLRKQSCITIAPGFIDAGALHPGAVGSAQDGCL